MTLPFRGKRRYRHVDDCVRCHYERLGGRYATYLTHAGAWSDRAILAAAEAEWAFASDDLALAAERDLLRAAEPDALAYLPGPTPHHAALNQPD